MVSCHQQQPPYNRYFSSFPKCLFSIYLASLQQTSSYSSPFRALQRVAVVCHDIAATLKQRYFDVECLLGRQVALYVCASLLLLFVCVEVLWPSQPNRVMLSPVSLPHSFIGQASSSKPLNSIVHILLPETDNCPFWISRRDRMTTENISWSNLHERMCFLLLTNQSIIRTFIENYTEIITWLPTPSKCKQCIEFSNFKFCKMGKHIFFSLTLLLLNTTSPVLANSVDPGQLASAEANWSGSALFVI